MSTGSDAMSSASASHKTTRRTSARNTSYDDLRRDTLQEIARIRGLLTAEKLLLMLLEQDRGHSERPFRFMALPAELRNQVYFEAVAEEGVIDLAHMRIPRLTAVSKQVRKESLELFLGCNTFTISPRRQRLYRPGIPYYATLERISAQTYFLRKIIVKLEVIEPKVGHIKLWLHLTHDDIRFPDFEIYVSVPGGQQYAHGIDRHNRMESRISDAIDNCARSHIKGKNGSFRFSADCIKDLIEALPVEVKPNGQLMFDAGSTWSGIRSAGDLRRQQSWSS
ncbi:hypothetical protein MBLNU457_g0332t1 [Dothideomycetes sp. NU457]